MTLLPMKNRTLLKRVLSAVTVRLNWCALVLDITSSWENRMNQIYNAANLLGRIFLIALYVWSGISKIGNFAFFEHYAATRGVTAWLLIASIVVELGGSLLLLLGYHTRIVALVLAGYTLIALLLFYGFHPAGLEAQIITFAELADAGGFLVLVGSGAGGWSLDAVLGHGQPRAQSA